LMAREIDEVAGGRQHLSPRLATRTPVSVSAASPGRRSISSTSSSFSNSRICIVAPAE
jgi:hypothetical protein